MDLLNLKSCFRLVAAVCSMVCAVSRFGEAQLSPPGKVNPALVGLDQNRDRQVPMDASFFDENGKQVQLSDYGNSKPVVLNLIFYKCPGVCVTELEGMIKLFSSSDLNLVPGKDFEVVTISINPKETPAIAKGKKDELMKQIGTPEMRTGWHFLSGSAEQVNKVAKVVGFRYVYDPVQDTFAHPAGIILMTPKGVTSKYFYGTYYPPKDVRFALIEASNNRIGTLSDRIILNCIYQYDPKSGRYGVAIVRTLQLASVLTVLVLATSILIMSKRTGKVELRSTQNVDKVDSEI